MTWAIFYADRTVRGSTQQEWKDAPDEGVQVVVEYTAPALHERRWTGVDDRKLWTGEDDYDPFGWGAKRGTLIGGKEYMHIWDRAAHGDRNA
jgi:hypothetical protein